MHKGDAGSSDIWMSSRFAAIDGEKFCFSYDMNSSTLEVAAKICHKSHDGSCVDINLERIKKEVESAKAMLMGKKIYDVQRGDWLWVVAVEYDVTSFQGKRSGRDAAAIVLAMIEDNDMKRKFPGCLSEQGDVVARFTPFTPSILKGPSLDYVSGNMSVPVPLDDVDVHRGVIPHNGDSKIPEEAYAGINAIKRPKRTKREATEGELRAHAFFTGYDTESLDSIEDSKARGYIRYLFSYLSKRSPVSFEDSIVSFLAQYSTLSRASWMTYFRAVFPDLEVSDDSFEVVRGNEGATKGHFYVALSKATISYINSDAT